MGLKISKIYIYPVKSFSGFETDNARALKSGFEYDRRWMIVDADYKFITQRTFPELARFQTKISGGVLSIFFNGEMIQTEIERMEGKAVEALVWDDKAITIETDPKVSTWISERMRGHFRLVRLKDLESRQHLSSNGINYSVNLADAYPFHMIGDKSLDDLNSKLEQKVDMLRFRPNLVFNAAHPYEEDGLKNFTIGEASFSNIKPCGRCIMINIEPEKMKAGKEPLRSLSTYRKSGNNVNFGINLVCEKEGMVKIGDSISVQKA